MFGEEASTREQVSIQHTYEKTNREETDASTASAQRIHKLGYDATAFEHEASTRACRKSETSTMRRRSATVGSMRLLASVRMRSASSELFRPTPERDHLEERLPAVLPLHYRVDGEFFDRLLPGTWRRTGWIGDKYTILNANRFHGRWENDYEDVSLSVTIEG